MRRWRRGNLDSVAATSALKDFPAPTRLPRCARNDASPATPHSYAALSWGLLHPAVAADQGDNLLAQVDDPAGLELGALELALGLELDGDANAQGAAERIGDLLP